MFYLMRNPTTTYEHLLGENDETNGNIEILQPYPAVAADAQLEFDTAVIEAI
jgi:hypothetical protein